MHKPSGVDFGRELAEGIEPEPGEYLIRKRRYSAFFATELDLVLRSYGAQTLILLGALTDVCVHYTAVDAHQHDYHSVVEDCVGGSPRTRRRCRRSRTSSGMHWCGATR